MRRRRYNPLRRRFTRALQGAVRVRITATLSSEPLLDTQIRLLRIRPGTGCIQCQLRTVDLSENPRYHALSYVWGDQTDRRPIKVNGAPFLVTKSLYEALETFRCMPSLDILSPPFRIWVDAICINQKDDNEKSRQVPRMMDIYGAAERVVVFLYTNEHWTSSSERMMSWQGYTIQPSNVSDKNKGLADFMQGFGFHPWFERIWTVQEAALARKPPILLYALHGSIGAATLEEIYEFAETNMPRGSTPNLKSMIDMRRWAQNPNGPDIPRFDNPGQMLESVLFYTGGRWSSILQDRVYGIYGLLQAVNTSFPDLDLPVVDYNQPAGQIFADITRLIIEHTQRTRIITYACVERRVPGMPTWVSNLRVCQSGATHFLNDNPDDNPELSEDGQALKITAVVTDYCEIVLSSVDISFEPGRVVERIEEIEKTLIKPIAERRSLDPDVLWPTMLGSRDFEELKHVRLEFDPSKTLDVQRLQRIGLHVMGSHFFATKDGFVGWCSGHTPCQIGNFICLRSSNEPPLLLRETSAPNTYEVIGPLHTGDKELSDTTGKVFKRIELV